MVVSFFGRRSERVRRRKEDRMKSVCVRSVVLGFAGLLLIGSSRSAEAAPEIQNVVGLWQGIYQSKVNMQDFNFFQVSIPSQDHRRFPCTLMILGNAISCDGTIAASGMFEVIARRGVFQVHGMYHGFGGGVALAMADYHFGDDKGSLVLLRQTGQPDPDVFGDWHGDYALMGGQAGMLMPDGAPRTRGDITRARQGSPADATMVLT